MSLSKVSVALATEIARRVERLAFLVMSGSFNPVHTQHLRAMENARQTMLRLGWHVIGGFLTPSDDQYVSGKLGSNAWPLSRRLELCRLATEDSAWIDVTPWAEFSAFRAADRLQNSIESGCREHVNSRPLIAAMVMGSDTAVRIMRRVLRDFETSSHEPWSRHGRVHWICCLMRPSANGSTEVQEITLNIRPRVEPLGIKIIMSDDCAQPLQDVSSRAIRSAIKQERWDELRDRGWLDPKVLDRLRSSSK